MKSKNKFHAKKVTAPSGETFDSKKEMARYGILKAKEKTGEIFNLERQVRFQLIPSQKGDNGRVIERPVFYKADFTYTMPDGSVIVEDVKGVRTKEYILKRKMMLWLRDIRIREV